MVVGDPQYAPLAAAGDPNGWRVVDFRPLRPLIHAGNVEGVTPELERWIFGFDAALLIGASRAATFDRLMAEARRDSPDGPSSPDGGVETLGTIQEVGKLWRRNRSDPPEPAGQTGSDSDPCSRRLDVPMSPGTGFHS